MLHDRHMLRWDVEIWLLPCETTRQRLNISPLSTPSSGRLLFWNLKLAGTCACESGFYFEAFFLLRGTLDEFYFDTLQIRPGQILLWKKNNFLCFVLFFSFVLSFYSSSPFLSFPFTWWKCRSGGSCIFWALFLFKLHTDCTNVENSHWFDNSWYCALPYTFFFCWWIMFTWLL